MNFYEGYEFFSERLWREIVKFPKKKFLSIEEITDLMKKNTDYFQKFYQDNIICRNVFMPPHQIEVIVTNLFYVKDIAPICPKCSSNKVFIYVKDIKDIDVHYLNKFFPGHEIYKALNVLPSSSLFAQNRPLVIRLSIYNDTMTNAKYYCPICKEWEDIKYDASKGLIF